MPNYEVEYACSLTEAQKDELAEAITKIHSEQFSTPKVFVNVRLTDIKGHDTYLGGKRRKINRIFAYVRHGPSRTQADYDAIGTALQNEWARIVPGTELRLVMFYGAIVAGMKSGFSVPAPGNDTKWVEDNWEAFVKKADDGDEEIAELVQQYKDRIKA